MKKVLALACALAMLTALAVPAMGEDTGKSLEDITLSVKQALDISDDYADFTSDQYDGNWNLTWTGATTTIYVTTTPEGEITNYSAYENGNDYTYSNDFTPHFPTAETEEINTISEDFLGRVIGEGKSWTLDAVTESLENGNVTSANVTGRLTIGEFPTDVTISLTIDLKDLKVTSYYRSDSYMKFGDQAADTAMKTTEEEARALLQDKTALTLEYYVVNSGDMAKLCYIRDYTGTYIVRASDGEIVNLDDLYTDGGEGGGEAMDTSNSGASASPVVKQLTDAELKGISVYDGALSAAELDKKARAFTEFGLTDEYALTSANYYNADGALVGSLTYSRKVPDEELASRYGLAEDQISEVSKAGNAYYDTKTVTLDANTGKLTSMYTAHPYIYGSFKNNVDVDASRTVSDAFIEKYFPDVFSSLQFTDSNNSVSPYYYSPTAYYNYVRLYNGYRFDGNSVTVSVNAEDGTIDSFTLNWNDAQEFEEPDMTKLITEDAAYQTYTKNLPFESALVSVPTSDGYGGYTYNRVLAWRYVDNYNAYGVDAVTGDLLSYSGNGSAAYAYSDIAGTAQQAVIEKLAQFSIGFSDGTFEPGKAFTMRDMLTLILQADGYSGLETWEYADLASSAENLGAPDFSQNDPDSSVTKGFFAGLIVDLYGLGDAAKFQGIYDCGFADDDSIAAADYGHIAIAYGMGLIAPDADNNIASDAELTRADGAQILYNFLARAK